MAEPQKRERGYLVTRPPRALALIVERDAAERNISVSGYLTELLARTYDFELTSDYRANRARAGSEDNRMSA